MGKKGYMPSDLLAGISMLRDRHVRERRLANWKPTPLNIATTARYEACKANGGHMFTDEVIYRTVDSANEPMRLHVCAACRVPVRVGKRPLGFNGKPIRVAA